jgi:hypothetical protein
MVDLSAQITGKILMVISNDAIVPPTYESTENILVLHSSDQVVSPTPIKFFIL